MAVLERARSCSDVFARAIRMWRKCSPASTNLATKLGKSNIDRQSNHIGKKWIGMKNTRSYRIGWSKWRKAWMTLAARGTVRQPAGEHGSSRTCDRFTQIGLRYMIVCRSFIGEKQMSGSRRVAYERLTNASTLSIQHPDGSLPRKGCHAEPACSCSRPVPSVLVAGEFARSLCRIENTATHIINPGSHCRNQNDRRNMGGTGDTRANGEGLRTDRRGPHIP